MTRQHETLMLVDGMALLFRGFYATASRGNVMTTPGGTPANGVYQFMRYLFNAVNRFSPTHIICCWDMGSETFRTSLYEDYKGNRSNPPEDLIPQFDLVKEVVKVFGIPNIGLENYEADDCIGTLAHQYAAKQNVLILTGDQDLLQLVNNRIYVAIMRKGTGNYEIFDYQNVLQKKGIWPQQIVDLKALMGDASDNYPGVKGIGEKTARKLIQSYETIEQILNNMDELPRGIHTKIQKNVDMLHLSRRLAAIKCDIPVECAVDQAVWDYDIESARKELAHLSLDDFATL